MAKFAVGFFSLFENELRMRIIAAENRCDAIYTMLEELGYEPPSISTDNEADHIELLKQHAFNCDCQIDAIAVPDSAEETDWVPPMPVVQDHNEGETDEFDTNS